VTIKALIYKKIGKRLAALCLVLTGFNLFSLLAQQVSSSSGSQADALTKAPQALEGTSLLGQMEDVQGVYGNPSYVIDQRLYDQAGEYFLAQIAKTPSLRDRRWQPEFSSRSAYEKSLSEHEQNLRKMLGLIELTPQQATTRILGESNEVRIEEVRFGLDGDFGVRALLFVAGTSRHGGAVIAIPDANQSPEEFAGIREGMTPALWLQALLGRGVAVAIPQMIERFADHPICQTISGQDRRRVLWRSGFIVGRTLVGMEVQQVTALAEYLGSRSEIDGTRISVWGSGQGGMTALYATAVDARLAGVVVQDYFDQREGSWKEPVDRVLYGQLNEFGDAEVAALIAPRPLIVVTQAGGPVAFESERIEAQRARRFYHGLEADSKLQVREVASNANEISARDAASIVGAAPLGKPLELAARISEHDILANRNEHFEALYRYERRLFAESDTARKDYWKLAATSAQARPEKAKQLRKELSELIGDIPDNNVPLHPRTLLIGETDKFLAYDVLLDTVPRVEAYGQLLVPRSAAGHTTARLPAVICQHGLGGAPEFVSGVGLNTKPNDHNDLYYRRFGERLAERGYVVFAPYVIVPSDPRPPQNVHRADLINPLVREAYPLGMLRTSLELAKLHRIVDFLQSLSFVDGQRIGYYGLSYGGYSAIWMPPLEPRLRFNIISGFFNSLRADLTTENSNNSYWRLPDLDMYPWNSLNRFSHTELIAAMWPRSTAVEWGLTDPTTTPEWHKLGWKDLKDNYIDPWSMTDKVIDAAYIGPHTIHGIETFYLIDRWLRPERGAGRDYGCDGDYCNLDVAADRHGYAPISQSPYITHFVNPATDSSIRGRFYISANAPYLTGLSFKLSRVGQPGDFVVAVGTSNGQRDLGTLRLSEHDVHYGYDLWYDMFFEHPLHLDPHKQYWFEVQPVSKSKLDDGYLIYGPKPLGGEDYPQNFGLSFRVIAKSEK
jgi:dienelactone hydrolase